MRTNTDGAETNLDARAHEVLVAIVEYYIAEGAPVGSRLLSKQLREQLSPATIRNVMLDLSNQGYLEQLHTSAGRTPSEHAYRAYVEALPPSEISGTQRETIDCMFTSASPQLEDLLEDCTRLLAQLTTFTGVSVSPQIGLARLRKVEFIRLNEHKIYAVLITESSMVHHRIVDLGETPDQESLNRVSYYLNEQFESRGLDEIRAELLDALVEERERYEDWLAQAARISKKALALPAERELYVEGLSHLVGELRGFASLQRLISALEEKEDVIELLDRGLEEPGLGEPRARLQGSARQMHVSIGTENPESLRDCALVSANYGNGRNWLGAIGILGPMRMNYAAVIPVIRYVAEALSNTIASR